MKIKKIFYNDFKIVEEFLLLNFSSPTHWPEWNLLVSKYYNADFYYFGLFEKRKLVGICPIHETKSGLRKILNSGQFHLIPNGGWLMNKEKEIDISNIPIPFNGRLECFALPAIKEFGATYLKTSKIFYTLLVDLKREEENIWLDCINSKRRNMIRKSLKMGVTLAKGADRFNDFYELYAESNTLLGFKGLPFDFFKELIKGSDNIHFVPFVAYQNDSPCSVIGLIHDKNYALYWLGATKHNSGNLGQGDLLQWEAIRHSKAHGCKYYDLCYIEKEKLPNIYEFKKGFSNTEVEVPFTTKKRIMFRILNKIQK
jgi:hypothetical protein